jgi:hypothetical protein
MEERAGAGGGRGEDLGREVFDIGLSVGSSVEGSSCGESDDEAQVLLIVVSGESASDEWVLDWAAVGCEWGFDEGAEAGASGFCSPRVESWDRFVRRAGNGRIVGRDLGFEPYVGRKSQAAFAGDVGGVARGNVASEEVGVQPSDQVAAGVVHGVVPAVVGRDRRRGFFIRALIDDRFSALLGEDFKRQPCGGFSEEIADEVVDDDADFTGAGDLTGSFGLIALVGEPGFDGVAG